MMIKVVKGPTIDELVAAFKVYPRVCESAENARMNRLGTPKDPEYARVRLRVVRVIQSGSLQNAHWDVLVSSLEWQGSKVVMRVHIVPQGKEYMCHYNPETGEGTTSLPLAIAHASDC